MTLTLDISLAVLEARKSGLAYSDCSHEIKDAYSLEGKL